MQSYSTEEGTRMRAFCYAQAMHAARVRYTLEHAGFQLDPLKVTEMLPLREEEYGLIPGFNDSIDERRAALAARLLAPKGGWYNNIKNALLTLLGDSFVQYAPTTVGQAEVTPLLCGDQPMNLISNQRLPKLIRLTPMISTGLGTPQWLRYQVVELEPIPDQRTPTLPPQNLLVGETLVVDPGHNVLHERCEVLDLRELVPGDPEILLEITKPHAAGTLATNYFYPFWRSTKRYNIAVLEASAAATPETRRKVNELLEKMVRVVSTWSIAQEDPGNPLHTGVFVVGSSRLGTQTLGDVVLSP